MTNNGKPPKNQNPEKPDAEKNALDQPDTEFSGRREAKGVTVGETEKLLKKHRFKLIDETTGKRIYRKTKEHLKDATQSPRAATNRLTKQLSPRVYEKHRDLFNRCADKFPSKREALERAIELLAKELELK